MFVPIKDYPGYMVNENGIVINKKGHVMRPALSNVGRPRVTLEIYDENGKLLKRDNKSISRLVAETFIPNPENLPVVMHKDNDPLHNHYTNLKWGTQSENIRQAFDEGRKVSPNKDKDLEKNLYEVYNNDRSDVIKCKGAQGVADLLGYKNSKTVRPGVVKSGKYEGYTVENTHIKVIKPISFEDTI